MTTHQPARSVSRRAAIAGVSASGLALAAITHSASARQDTALDDHPLTGMWLAMANPLQPDAPQFPAPSWYGADGTVVLSFPITQAGPSGVQVNSIVMGTWEAFDETTGHFTAVQTTSDLDGNFTGSVTIDGFPQVSENGESFIDDGSMAFITIRDPAGVIVAEVPGLDQPVTGLRMAPGSPGFPDAGATPEASPES